jgi:hypothetical protein
MGIKKWSSGVMGWSNGRQKVSVFRFQEGWGFQCFRFKFLTPRMKLRQNGTVFLMIKLAASMAGGGAEP